MDLKYLKEIYEDEYDEKITLREFTELVEETLEQLIRDKEL